MRIWLQAMETLLVLILACNLGNNSPSIPRTIKNVGRQLVIYFPLWCNDHTRQPSFSSARSRVSTVFFVARSAHRLPGILMPRTALASNEPGCSFVVHLFHRLFMYLLLIFRLLTRAWCWVVSGLHPWQAWQRRYLVCPVCPCI